MGQNNHCGCAKERCCSINCCVIYFLSCHIHFCFISSSLVGISSEPFEFPTPFFYPFYFIVLSARWVVTSAWVSNNGDRGFVLLFSLGYRPIIVICNPEGVTMFLLEDHNLAAWEYVSRNIEVGVGNHDVWTGPAYPRPCILVAKYWAHGSELSERGHLPNCQFPFCPVFVLFRSGRKKKKTCNINIL